MTMTLGPVLGTVNLSVAAAGTTQATATPLAADHSLVTSATAGSAEGVLMKAGNANEFVSVANGTSTSIKVYPPSGAKLNNQTADLPMVLPPGRTMWAVFLNAANISTIAG